jgi:hypothetical protein
MLAIASFAVLDTSHLRYRLLEYSRISSFRCFDYTLRIEPTDSDLTWKPVACATCGRLQAISDLKSACMPSAYSFSVSRGFRPSSNTTCHVKTKTHFLVVAESDARSNRQHISIVCLSYSYSSCPESLNPNSLCVAGNNPCVLPIFQTSSCSPPSSRALFIQYGFRTARV